MSKLTLRRFVVAVSTLALIAGVGGGAYLVQADHSRPARTPAKPASQPLHGDLGPVVTFESGPQVEGSLWEGVDQSDSTKAFYNDCLSIFRTVAPDGSNTMVMAQRAGCSTTLPLGSTSILGYDQAGNLAELLVIANNADGTKTVEVGPSSGQLQWLTTIPASSQDQPWGTAIFNGSEVAAIEVTPGMIDVKVSNPDGYSSDIGLYGTTGTTVLVQEPNQVSAAIFTTLNPDGSEKLQLQDGDGIFTETLPAPKPAGQALS